MNILIEIIYPVVEEFQASVSEPSSLQKSPETVLLGPNAALDSLALVSFIVAVEERVEKITGEAITLADEKAMSRKASPFRTIATLDSYIAECIKAENHG